MHSPSICFPAARLKRVKPPSIHLRERHIRWLDPFLILREIPGGIRVAVTRSWWSRIRRSNRTPDRMSDLAPHRPKWTYFRYRSWFYLQLVSSYPTTESHMILRLRCVSFGMTDGHLNKAVREPSRGHPYHLETLRKQIHSFKGLNCLWIIWRSIWINQC